MLPRLVSFLVRGIVVACAALFTAATLLGGGASDAKRHSSRAPLHAKRTGSLPALVPARAPVIRIDFLAAPPLLQSYAPRAPANPAYLNYDFRASPRDAHASFDYGLRLGTGIAQLSTLARLFGESRGVMVTGLSWQRYSDSGNTLIVGDSESRRGLYEDTVRFDGIQYSSPDFSYDAGWQRTDAGDAPMHVAGFIAQATAAKDLTSHLRAEAHMFSGSGTLLIGAGATWSNAHLGDVHFGFAPARGHGVTGFFGYSLHSRKLKFTLDDRAWSAQNSDPAQLAQPNYRQLRAAIEYAASPVTKVRLIYGSQTQGFLSARTLTLGYVRHIGDAEAHVDFAAASSGTRRSAGFTTYLSVPLSSGRSFLEQSSLSGGVPESAVTLKQDLPDSQIGTGYALKFENAAGTSLTDATFHAQTSGSSAQVELLRVGPRVDWNSEVSGSLVFFGGKRLAVNQTIDASGAFETLKGRTAVKMRVVAESGKALPPGAIVRALYEPGEWRLSSNGYVELDQVTPGPQTFIVTTPSATCVIATIVPPPVAGEPDIGTQICR